MPELAPKGRRPADCPGACSCTAVCGQAVIDGDVEVWQEIMVCGAPGYPDPPRMHPATLEHTLAFLEQYAGRDDAKGISVMRRGVSEWNRVSGAVLGDVAGEIARETIAVSQEGE